MGIEKSVQNVKNFGKKLVLGCALTGLLSLTNCEEINLTGDITIKEEGVGELVGKIVWDPDEDGIYNGVSADVGLDTWPWLNAKYETKSNSEGNFSFHDIPVKSYTIHVQKNVDVFGLWHYWRAKKGVTVTKQQVSNVGNIKIIDYHGPGY